jgi:hypothetical protein
MREKRKDPMLVPGFLLDRDVSKAVSLFPAKITRTIAQVGLPDNASDAAIIKKAWQLRRTIVTGNGDDFVKEMLKFQRRTKQADCHEMFGLVVLPNGYENQKRLLQMIGTRLRLGTKKLTWADVAEKNYYVRVKKGGDIEVKRFPRCFYCQKLEVHNRL